MLASILERLGIASAATTAAESERAKLAADLDRLTAEHATAADVFDRDPSDKHGRAVIVAREARDLAQLRVQRAAARLDAARAEEEAATRARAEEEARIEHARRLEEARKVLPGARSKLAAAREATRKARAAREQNVLPVGLRQAIDAAALTHGQASGGEADEALAAAALAEAEDAVAALDPAYAATLAATREESRRAAEEKARGAALARLTIPGYAAEHEARVKPLLALAREVLRAAVVAAGDLAAEHRALAAEHGIDAPYIQNVENLSAALHRLDPGEVDPKLAGDIQWLAPPTADMDQIQALAIDAFGYGIPGAPGTSTLAPRGGIPLAEQIRLILEGRTDEVTRRAQEKNDSDKLVNLSRAHHTARRPSQRAHFAWEELAFSRQIGRWNGDPAEREAFLVSVIREDFAALLAAALKHQDERIRNAPPRARVTPIPGAFPMDGERHGMFQITGKGETIEAAIAATLEIPPDVAVAPAADAAA